MSEPEAIANARRVLGAHLAACRRAAGLSQQELADEAGFSRSAIGNAETGRPGVSSDFWVKVDKAVSAGGSLIAEYAKIDRAARLARAREVQQPENDPAQATAPVVISPPVRLQQDLILTPLSAAPGVTESDLLTAAAAQACDHAAHAAVTGIGPGTLEQLTAEVVRLSRTYVAGSPLPLFEAMHEALGRVHEALDQRLYPAQARDLNFLAGVLCGLMANASLDLGREDTAEDLARAAWTYGTIIDHHPLIGWARGTQALAAIWDHRYADAAHYAEDGLTHLSSGAGAARLHAIQARALADHHDFREARAALTAATDASTSTESDQLHDGIAGEFTFGAAKLRYYEALVLNRVGYPADAETAAVAAISLYEAAPGQARSYGCDALAHVQLATARLMRGDADAAAEAITSLLRLDPGRRISSLNEHIDACRELLRGPAFRNSRAAADMSRQLTAFSAVNITSPLPLSR